MTYVDANAHHPGAALRIPMSHFSPTRRNQSLPVSSSSSKQASDKL